MDWQWERASSKLLQNCDLPPPLKIFSPLEAQENKTVLTTIVQWEAEVRPVYQAENTSLLRALRLSQSRAREAEKKAAAACKSKEQMSSFLMDESIRLSTHKRWVRLLETQILLLGEKKRLIAREEEGDGFSTLTWCLTLALCLGMGFSLGRYVF